MNKNTFLLVVVFTTVLMVCLFTSCATTSAQNKSGEPTTAELSEISKLDTSILVTFIRRADYSDEVSVKRIEYPEFYHLDELNESILNTINSYEAEFDQLLTANREVMAAAGSTVDLQGSFHVGWKKSQMNGNYISIILEIYYYAGGANGITYMQSYNYDVKNKRFLTLNDILVEPRTLAEISETVRAEIESTYNPSYDINLNAMITVGTSPKPDNFSVFVFDEDTITFWFQKYQVLPGSFGTPTVTLSR